MGPKTQISKAGKKRQQASRKQRNGLRRELFDQAKDVFGLNRTETDLLLLQYIFHINDTLAKVSDKVLGPLDESHKANVRGTLQAKHALRSPPTESNRGSVWVTPIRDGHNRHSSDDASSESSQSAPATSEDELNESPGRQGAHRSGQQTVAPKYQEIGTPVKAGNKRSAQQVAGGTPEGPGISGTGRPLTFSEITTKHYRKVTTPSNG